MAHPSHSGLGLACLLLVACAPLTADDSHQGNQLVITDTDSTISVVSILDRVNHYWQQIRSDPLPPLAVEPGTITTMDRATTATATQVTAPAVTATKLPPIHGTLAQTCVAMAGCSWSPTTSRIITASTSNKTSCATMQACTAPCSDQADCIATWTDKMECTPCTNATACVTAKDSTGNDQADATTTQSSM